MARLRHAVALDHRRAERRFQVAHHLRRQGRRGGAEEAQLHPPDDLPVALRPRQDRLVHGRHRRVPGGPLRIEPAEEAQRVEARRADHRPAARERGQRRRDQPVDVEQRHHVEAGVVRRQLPGSARCCRAEAVTLRWVSGTIFGRAVVPEVCSTSATSSALRPCPAAPALPGLAALQDEAARAALHLGHQLQHRHAQSLRHRPRRRLDAPLHDQRPRLQVGQVELELLVLVGRVQRRRGGARRRSTRRPPPSPARSAARSPPGRRGRRRSRLSAATVRSASARSPA